MSGNVKKRIGLRSITSSSFKVNSAGEERDRFIAKCVYLLLLIYMLFAMVQSLLSFSMNRIVGVMLVSVLVLDFVTHLSNKKVISTCFLSISATLAIAVFTTNYINEVEFYVYFSAALLILVYVTRSGTLSNLKNAVSCYGCFADVCLIGCTVFLIFLLVSRVGYRAGGYWGNEVYFIGFCNTEHTMSSVCCMMMTLGFLRYKQRKSGKILTLFVFLVAAYAIFQTGARTYLVPCAIIFLFFVFDSDVVTKRWMRVGIVFVLSLVAVYLFSTTSMISKFIFLRSFSGESTGADFVNIMMSGRLGYWYVDLKEFFRSNLFNQLFGNSASFVFDLNEVTFQMRIWAHDDFVMVLCSAGYVGLCIYGVALSLLCRTLRNNMSRWQFWALIAFIFFPAIINGFYQYQPLLYGMIFLLCASSTDGCFDATINGRAK